MRFIHPHSKLTRNHFLQFTKANKKRQTTLTLPPASAQDMLKENKISSPSNSSSSHISSNQQLSKSQALSTGSKVLGAKIKPIGKIQAFSKKDVNVLTSAKKKKVLCEASVGTTVVSAVGAGLANQIPRKKIKVSNVGGSGTFMKGDQASSSLITSSAQASENELTKFFLSSAKTMDDEMIPCCSKNISSFLKAPSSPSGSSTSSGQMKITSFLPIKKLTKTRKLKFGKPSARIGLKKLMSSDAQSTVALSIDTASTPQALSPSSKLLKKKKRSLKSERKKSRSQKPLLH